MDGSVTITTPAPGAISDPNHDQSMIDKFESANTPPETPNQTSTTPVRPADVPEKFWDAEKGIINHEALLKSYNELSSKIGKPQDPPATLPADDQQQPKAQPVVQPVDYAKYSTEFLESGELSADSYAELEKAGYDRGMVDAYLEGQKALAATIAQKAYEIAGGQSAYEAMVDWGAQHLSDEEIEAFDQAIQGTDAQKAAAIRDLKSRYTEAVGNPPTLINGSERSTGTAYESTAQMKADMKDPRYKNDPAFRAEVERKLANSTIF